MNSKSDIENTPNLVIKGLIGESFLSPNGFPLVNNIVDKLRKILVVLVINVEDSKSTNGYIWTKESVTIVKHSLCYVMFFGHHNIYLLGGTKDKNLEVFL